MAKRYVTKKRVRKVYGVAYGVALAQLRNRDRAQDVAQKTVEAYIRAVKGDKLRKPDKYAAWAHGAADRLVKRAFDELANAPLGLLPYEGEPAQGYWNHPVAEEVGFADRLLQEEDEEDRKLAGQQFKQTVDMIVETKFLPKSKAFFELRFRRKKKLQVVADSMGVTYAAAKMYNKRMMDRLVKLLLKELEDKPELRKRLGDAASDKSVLRSRLQCALKNGLLSE